MGRVDGNKLRFAQQYQESNASNHHVGILPESPKNCTKQSLVAINNSTSHAGRKVAQAPHERPNKLWNTSWLKQQHTSQQTSQLTHPSTAKRVKTTNNGLCTSSSFLNLLKKKIYFCTQDANHSLCCSVELAPSWNWLQVCLSCVEKQHVSPPSTSCFNSST